MAQSCYARKDWQGCYDAALRSLEVKDKNLVYTMNPEVWGPLPHDLLAIAAFHLKYYDVAIEHGEKAYALDTTNDRLRSNIEHYKSAIE